MEKEYTIKNITELVEKISTTFEKTNTEIKRKYIIWNIESFNTIASAASANRGTFGTGYPFYALGENLQGTLPIIQEQIRYNRQLVKDGKPMQQSIWVCKKCLEQNYANMPNLKKICKLCQSIIDPLKPRKIINRLPDFDMWMVCEDGKTEQAEKQLSELLERYNMHTSDKNPLNSIKELYEISEMLQNGEIPRKYLPIDLHVIEYSKLKQLIEQVPNILQEAKNTNIPPHLLILPSSYRKQWENDDTGYNFIFDYLASFTAFNFPTELQQALNNTRKSIVSKYTPTELLEFLQKASTEQTLKRFETVELKRCFLERMKRWKAIDEKCDNSDVRKQEVIDDEYLI